jgi:hypothetical protein
MKTVFHIHYLERICQCEVGGVGGMGAVGGVSEEWEVWNVGF